MTTPQQHYWYDGRPVRPHPGLPHWHVVEPGPAGDDAALHIALFDAADGEVRAEVHWLRRDRDVAVAELWRRDNPETRLWRKEYPAGAPGWHPYRDVLREVTRVTGRPLPPELHEHVSQVEAEEAPPRPPIPGGAGTWGERGPAEVRHADESQQISTAGTEPIVTPAEASASAGPCTVTGYFASNVGPTLHYTLASAGGDVLDYSRAPDSNVTVQVQAGNRWIDLTGQDPRYQAVIRGVQEHEARYPDLAGYNNPQTASAARPGDTPGGMTRVPATIGFTHLQDFERTAPDGTPATVKFRRGQQLQPGDVISGQRDPWAVVTHITWSGPQVAIRVQEAGGSRTMTSGIPGPSLQVRADLRVDPSTCPDIPDGFPPRWGVWRSGPGQSRETTPWFPEPGLAAQHARQASRDGNEYVVELESPDGGWTQVDAYQQGRRSAWGTQLAVGPAETVMPPWATPAPAKTAERYVVARINKTYGTLGEHPGPQHVGRAFVPYDGRHLSKEAAEESARVSNDRYRPSLHGRTFVAVRAEPIPGTNKFRNLDHPSLARKATTPAGTALAGSASAHTRRTR